MKAIEGETCVDAWLQACDFLLSDEAEDWRAYNVVLEVARPIELPAADRAIVGLVDRFLTTRGGLPVNSVVNTIFPALMYQRYGANKLAERYLTEVCPGLKRHSEWRWGTYAERLFQRLDPSGKDIKPLETLVQKLRTQLSLPGPQRAAYELSAVDVFADIPIYDPVLDRNRPIGGPCLAHLSVKLTADRRLMLTGFYRSHFYVQRALGNLLGLAHLQNFIAKETGLEMGPLVCHSSMAQLELQTKKWGKADVIELVAHAHLTRRQDAA
jgi:hypothetical protein